LQYCTLRAGVVLPEQTSKLALMRAGLTLLGMTATPRSIWKRIRTWAGDLLYLRATAARRGSSSRDGSSGVAHGRSGEPSGLYAVTVIACARQNPSSFSCVWYGWHSTCTR
jgi:hypothetical protein